MFEFLDLVIKDSMSIRQSICHKKSSEKIFDCKPKPDCSDIDIHEYLVKEEIVNET